LTNPSLVYEKQKLETLATKVELAGNLKESLLFSEQWIYENVFNMSRIEWEQEQEQVIEDLKQDFRKEQIKSEGNDPVKTNMSFGTPHDIASMHVSTKFDGLAPGMEQEHVAGPGRPKDVSTWGKHSSPHGRDPLGAKEMSKTFSTDKSPLQHNFKNGSPLSTESIESKAIIDTLKSKFKSPKILKQSLNESINDTDAGTMLDERQLLDQ
jgi:hypothetical protein